MIVEQIKKIMNERGKFSMDSFDTGYRTGLSKFISEISKLESNLEKSIALNEELFKEYEILREYFADSYESGCNDPKVIDEIQQYKARINKLKGA
jgi:hypothetical protein